MKCRQFKDVMDAYLDQELTQNLVHDFLEHEMQCDGCAHLLTQRKELMGMLQTTLQEDWNIDISDGVMDRVYSESLPAQPSPMKIPIILAIISFIFSSALLFLIGIAGFPGGFSPLEAVQGIVVMIELPTDVEQSIMELIDFSRGCWIAFRGLAHMGLYFLKILLWLMPYLIIPIVILAGTAIGYLWFVYHRTRNHLARF